MTMPKRIDNPRTAEDFATNWIVRSHEDRRLIPYLTEEFEKFARIVERRIIDQVDSPPDSRAPDWWTAPV